MTATKVPFALSAYGEQMAGPSVIGDLMQDLGEALNRRPDLLFLGGGNPALIPAVNRILNFHWQALGEDLPTLARSWGVYQSPQGYEPLLSSLAVYLRAQGWPVTERNLVVVNGGQTACHRIFNLFAGASASGVKRVALPMTPEYVGYRGLLVGGDAFYAPRPRWTLTAANRFRYQANPEDWTFDKRVGLVCLSRPTNPSAHVMPKALLAQLVEQTQSAGLPLLVDNAYGMPFPGIMPPDQAWVWQPGTLALLSASKLGLPGLRTAIVVADEPVVQLLAKTGAVENLAAGNIGPYLLQRLVDTGDIRQMTIEIASFYALQRQFMLTLLDEHLRGIPYAIQEPDGAFFVWLWLPKLPISSQMLYQRLKAQGLLVMAGEGFFFGHEAVQSAKDPALYSLAACNHARQCLRLNLCQSRADMAEAIARLGLLLKTLHA